MESAVEAGLREVVAAREALDSLEAALVARARSRGSTWLELAGVLGLSKQGVRKRHLAVDPIFARRPRRAQTIDEFHEELTEALRARARSLG